MDTPVVVGIVKMIFSGIEHTFHIYGNVEEVKRNDYKDYTYYVYVDDIFMYKTLYKFGWYYTSTNSHIYSHIINDSDIKQVYRKMKINKL